MGNSVRKLPFFCEIFTNRNLAPPPQLVPTHPKSLSPKNQLTLIPSTQRYGVCETVCALIHWSPAPVFYVGNLAPLRPYPTYWSVVPPCSSSFPRHPENHFRPKKDGWMDGWIFPKMFFQPSKGMSPIILWEAIGANRDQCHFVDGILYLGSWCITFNWTTQVS